VSTRLRGTTLQNKIHQDPGWAMCKLLGQKPWAKQIELVRTVFDNDRTECSGCVSSTKTYTAAMLTLLWLLRWGPGSRVFSIAPSFRQVDTNLWGYIPKLVRAAENNGTPLGCKIYDKPHVEFANDWYYEGFSTDRGENVHGIHGPHDLLILDDAHGISRDIMDELENMMAGGTAHILMLHNRVVSSGPSFDVAHKDAALWAHVSISFYDLPNSDPKRVAEWIPGAISIKAVEAWAKKYGEKSNFYRSKVLNEYPTAAPDTLIPLDWIESAFNRKANNKGLRIFGGDIARFGDDSSAIAPIKGREVEPVTSWHNFDLMYTTGVFAQALRAERNPSGTEGERTTWAFLDVVGMGGGPVDRLVEQQLPAIGVDCGEEAEGMVQHGDRWRPAKEVFVNKRSQMWWNLRDRLDPASREQNLLISLPADMELQAQLSAVKYRLTSDGRIEVEPKHASSTAASGSRSKWGLKNRLGYSPDKADAVVLAVWGADHCATSNSVAAAISSGHHAEPVHEYAPDSPIGDISFEEGLI
jgi:hypothetical protein